MHALKRLPDQLFVACSGGIDSVVLAHFAKQQRRDVTLAFFHHGNEFADVEEEFVIRFASEHDFPLIRAYCHEPVVGSKEKFWRDQRYDWFRSLPGQVAIGTHLDDAVEWYLMTCLQGQGHYIEYQSANCVKPLLCTTKHEITVYAAQQGLQHLTDPSNANVAYTARNRVRHNIVPECLTIQPGLYNIVRKRIFEKTHGARHAATE